MRAIMRGERQACDSREKARAIAVKNYTASGGTGTYHTVFVSTQGKHQAPLTPAADGGAAHGIGAAQAPADARREAALLADCASQPAKKPRTG